MTNFYKNKPKVLEAIQFDGTNLNEVLEFIKGKADYFINDAAWKVGKAPPTIILKFESNSFNNFHELHPGMYLAKICDSEDDTIYLYTQKMFESKYEKYVPFEQFVEDLGL